MKQYIINEDFLHRLITNSLYLEWLEINGWDDPPYTGVNPPVFCESVINEILTNKDEAELARLYDTGEIKDFSFDDVARYELQYGLKGCVPYDANKLEDDLK